MCARSPAHYFEVSEPTISVHLKILKSAGLIIGEKKVSICTAMLSGSILRT
ncbi:MAG: ArsR family transcriptional regulator [Lentisphaeria bacterium]|nr:ArsR family transcriptional regulator [Lentisphaeria bacterium]